MRYVHKLFVSTLIGGVVILLPLYLSILLILKAFQSVLALLRPLASLLPEWVPRHEFVAIAAILMTCLAVGVAVRTPPGRAIRQRLERSLFGRLPGYAIFRSLTQRIAGHSGKNEWKPALVEIEEALVPAFIVEELDGGRFTVFVPSVPTPLAGAIYILAGDRVHPIDVPFTQAIKVVSQWGSGSRALVAAMESPPSPTPEPRDQTGRE